MEWGPGTRDSITVLSALRFRDKIGSEGAVDVMDAQYYTAILEKGIFPFVDKEMEDNWTLHVLVRESCYARV